MTVFPVSVGVYRSEIIGRFSEKLPRGVDLGPSRSVASVYSWRGAKRRQVTMRSCDVACLFVSLLQISSARFG